MYHIPHKKGYHTPIESKCKPAGRAYDGGIHLSNCISDSMQPVIELQLLKKAQEVSKLIRWPFLGGRKAHVQVQKSQSWRTLYDTLGITGLKTSSVSGMELSKILKPRFFKLKFYFVFMASVRKGWRCSHACTGRSIWLQNSSPRSEVIEPTTNITGCADVCSAESKDLSINGSPQNLHEPQDIRKKH